MNDFSKNIYSICISLIKFLFFIFLNNSFIEKEKCGNEALFFKSSEEYNYSLRRKKQEISVTIGGIEKYII
jgi:hypothetical protein